MKRNIKSLIGYTMHATDGEIGKVEEFYFDDRHWKVRYLIVRTGGWLSGRKVLISPQALLPMDWENSAFPINLSKEQIRDSPEIDTDEPVSRQQEERLYTHYPWQGYWNGAFAANGVWGILPDTTLVDEAIATGNGDQPHGDAHLRSTKAVTGYHIHAIDGEIGEVTDYIADDATWDLNYLVVRTGSRMKPVKILLSVKWITEVRWDDSTIVVDITIDRVKHSRLYDEVHYIDTAYEQVIFDHYGKPMQEDRVAFHLK